MVLLEHYKRLMKRDPKDNRKDVEAVYLASRKTTSDLQAQLRQRAQLAKKATLELAVQAKAFQECRRKNAGTSPGNTCAKRFKEYDMMGVDEVSADDVMDDEANA